jgi:O-antigen/teichoic acid export membrane protein
MNRDSAREPAPEARAAPPDHGVRDDARSLTRALGLQVLGYAFKAGLPFLLALATQAYGLEVWGVFVALQALVTLALRVAVFGLDKATLWWVGGHEPREMPRVLFPSLAVALLLSLTVAASLALGGRSVLSRWDSALVDHVGTLLVMSISLPVMALTDIVLHASMGQRKLGAQVAIRDTIVPIGWLVLALAFHALGLHRSGLAWAFVASQAIGLVAAVWLMRGALRTFVSLRPPEGLLRYASAVWANEIANTSLQRIDALLLAALTDPTTVGIWGVIVQFGNAMRSIRRAFDPILVAVTARISRAHDPERLAHALSYATQLVSLSQFPVFAALLLWSGLLLPMYGPGFEQGSTALVVLCAFWLVSGAISLPGIVLAGYGHARLGLMVTLIGIAIEVPLMFWLVPRYGLVGASTAIGVANILQQVVQLVLMKHLTGSLNYNERARRPLVPTAVSGAATALTWLAVESAGGSDWQASGAASAVFVLVYGVLVGSQWRRGLLRAPGND